MEYTQQQQIALGKIQSFLNEKQKRIFILKGYAGTGKTTLIRAIYDYAKANEHYIYIMTPTGRAAKVLRNKINCPAVTIHKAIYRHDKFEAVRHDEHGNIIKVKNQNRQLKDYGSDNIKFWFDIAAHDTGDNNPEKRLIIVDEASMVTKEKHENETFSFGTDKLLDDLLTFSEYGLGAKLIFIGDSAQLPPIGENFSACLSEEYFQNIGISTDAYELIEVVRQKQDSLILKNAMKIRDLLCKEKRNTLVFETDNYQVKEITHLDVIQRFTDLMPVPEMNKIVCICYSNTDAKVFNDAIREKYFPYKQTIVAGDILQIVKNNYNKNLFNGDFVKVLNVSDTKETQSAPVWIAGPNGKERVNISLDFRDVELLNDSGEMVNAKIIDSLLYNNNRGLSHNEAVALYINFRMRHPELDPDEEAFSTALREDIYFNALQAKFGYAITCHKSQGGEWDNVFVDYTRKIGFSEESLRWMYTATTRAKETLYGINLPKVSPVSKIKFNPINTLNKPNKEAFSYANVNYKIDLLGENVTLAQKNKYLCILANLKDNNMDVEKIECFPYMDRYSITTNQGIIKVDCRYNGSGIYSGYSSNSTLPCKQEVLGLLADESQMNYEINYHPQNEEFLRLYNIILSACNELQINITNIVEHFNQFYVSYYFKSKNGLSSIQFYFDKNNVFSSAIPSCEKINSDLSFQNLIQKIQDNAI